jgi:nucleoside-diphosphate-sugar epimerase
MVELLATEQGFSNTRLATELGYRPRVDFDEGMRGVESWLRAEGLIQAPS